MTHGQDQSPYVVLKRAAASGTLAGAKLPFGTVESALNETADTLLGRALRLARRSAVLPADVLDAQNRPIFARRVQPGLSSLVLTTASALRASEMPSPVTAEALTDLHRKHDSFTAIKLRGDLLLNSAMDLRLVYGGLQWFLVDKVMGYVSGRLEDEAVPKAEKDALLRSFAPMLVAVDEMLSRGPERKDELSKLRRGAAAKLEESLLDRARSELEFQVNHGLMPDRQRLIEVARRYMKAQKDGAPGTGVPGTGVPGTSTPGQPGALGTPSQPGQPGQPGSPTSPRKVIR